MRHSLSECILAKGSGECVKVGEGRGREMDTNGSEFAEPTRIFFLYYFS